MSRLLAICLIGMWSACSINGAAAEPLFLPHQSNEVELVKGPVRRLIVVTKETIATLSFSRPGELTEKITVHRDDAADAPGETTLYRYNATGYRYNATGQRTGEYIVGDEGELVPMRLYAYGDNGQVFANAAYHQCRTFSALHLYIYDGSGRLVRNVEFASRRLTKRDFQYDQQDESSAPQRIAMGACSRLLIIPMTTGAGLRPLYRNSRTAPAWINSIAMMSMGIASCLSRLIAAIRLRTKPKSRPTNTTREAIGPGARLSGW